MSVFRNLEILLSILIFLNLWFNTKKIVIIKQKHKTLI